jgi:hypothetical protein
MAGLQTIIDKCSSITINRRKMIGIQITRNEIPRISQTPTRNPWRFSLEMPSSLYYYNNRDLLEVIDNLDRMSPQVITFSNNSCLSWIFAYQGSLSLSQRNGLTISSFVGTTLRLTGLPGVASSTVMFKQNDLIQIGNFPYPFTVVGPYSGGVTTYGNVTRGTAAFVDITMHRPNILGSTMSGYGITVGNACNFNMFCQNMPTYKLNPGGYVGNNGSTTNNALIEFSDSFELYEYVGAA